MGPPRPSPTAPSGSAWALLSLRKQELLAGNHGPPIKDKAISAPPHTHTPNLAEQNKARTWGQWPQAEAFSKPGAHAHIQTPSPLYLCPQVGSSAPGGVAVRRVEEEVEPFLVQLPDASRACGRIPTAVLIGQLPSTCVCLQVQAWPVPNQPEHWAGISAAHLSSLITCAVPAISPPP